MGNAVRGIQHPNQIQGYGLSVCVNGLSNFIVAIAIPSMMANRGYQTYIFFTVMCLLATVWAVLLVPDTKGKTLEEMDEVFGDVQVQEGKPLCDKQWSRSTRRLSESQGRGFFRNAVIGSGLRRATGGLVYFGDSGSQRELKTSFTIFLYVSCIEQKADQVNLEFYYSHERAVNSHNILS